MIDNALSNSIRFVAKDTGMSEFLVKPVEHEDIKYFTFKMRKDFFNHRP